MAPRHMPVIGTLLVSADGLSCNTTPPDPQSDITHAPESSPLLGGSVTDVIDAPISESAFSSCPRRSSRLTRRPTYLKDYVT